MSPLKEIVAANKAAVKQKSSNGALLFSDARLAEMAIQFEAAGAKVHVPVTVYAQGRQVQLR